MTIVSYIIFFTWFIVLILSSFVNDKVWSRIFPGKKYRFFIAPGVIVHELSHVVACIFTRAKIFKISLFSKTGGYVEHSRSRFGFLGNSLISIAPIFGVSLFLWAVIFWFGYQLEFQTISFGSDILENFRKLFTSAWELIRSGAGQWQFWIFLYLVISLALALAPSAKDFKNAIWGLVILFVIGLLILYYQGTNEFLSNLIGKYLGRVVTLAVIWEIITLIIGLPIYFLQKILTR